MFQYDVYSSNFKNKKKKNWFCNKPLDFDKSEMSKNVSKNCLKIYGNLGFLKMYLIFTDFYAGYSRTICHKHKYYQ